MNYQHYTLSNGLKVVFKLDTGAVTHCGIVVNTGSRDETESEHGMAHFIEHMLFKGTQKRRSAHIINRLENVGGELNAFTSKEETVVYASVLNEYAERAIELIADITLHSTFPQKEIDKEVVIIIDEIQSYQDNPSDLIFDDFEEILFEGNPLAHNILGGNDVLKNASTHTATTFISKNYRPQDMVLFVLGNLPLKSVLTWATKYLEETPFIGERNIRKKPDNYSPKRMMIDKNTHQVHLVLGNIAYNMYQPQRMGMYLLNNILGGPGMNSLLNLSLREKHGLVYHVESNFQPLTDTGSWTVYFGCDAENASKCEQLVYAELKKLRESLLSENTLKKYKLQLLGQMAMAAENKENLALSYGKSFLRYGKVDSLATIRTLIEQVTAKELQSIACEIFEPTRISTLIYK